MIATAKDLRFNISQLFDTLSKGEDIIITYRGKQKAKLISTEYSTTNEKKDDLIFGMWKDRDISVDDTVRNLRKSRTFGI